VSKYLLRGILVAGAWLFAASHAALAQEEQDDVSKALDSTATQWSLQMAYQTMPDYHSDAISPGVIRPPGATDYFQLRTVAPLVFDNFTILPRLTIRHYENQQGQSGFGNTELFALIIPKSWDWGTGRFGIGPLITAPGDKEVARDEWGYGFAGGAVNTAGNWFYGLLLTQTWRGVDPANLPVGSSDTNALGLAPFLNYQLGDGWYVGNGDMVAQYDWDTSKFYMPIGVRFGKVNVKPNGSWNFYFEYQTALIYDDWPGPAVKNSYRFNVSYTWPVGK
jgi:hypothetical protein